MSSSSDSDSSQFSYVSGESVDDETCLPNRSNASSDSETSVCASPVHGFTEEEREEMVASVGTLSYDKGIVYLKDILSSPAVDKLRLLPWSISVVSASMKELLQLTEVRHKPEGVVMDVCVFSDRNPLMILTFSSTNDRKTTLYNSSLAREIMMRLNNYIDSFLTCSHGVVDPSSEEAIITRISKLREEHKLFAVPISLHMSAERCSTMLRYFVDMTPIPSSRCSSLSSVDKEELFPLIDQYVPMIPDSLTLEDKNEILRFPNTCQGGPKIVPGKVWIHLWNRFPKLCENVEKILGETYRLLIVQMPKHELLAFEETPYHESEEIPELLFDIFAIDHYNPTMVLTFAEQTTRSTVDHNNFFAAHFQKTMNKDIAEFSCVRGVVETLDTQTQEDFELRVCKIKQLDGACGREDTFATDEKKCQLVKTLYGFYLDNTLLATRQTIDFNFIQPQIQRGQLHIEQIERLVKEVFEENKIDQEENELVLTEWLDLQEGQTIRSQREKVYSCLSSLFNLYLISLPLFSGY